MNEVEKTIEILNQGGIVIFPTDTAFGIGCRIDKPDSIRKLFDIRKRPEEKAVPVLVDSIEMAKEYLEEVDEDIENLMKKYWPGALTIIYECKKDKVYSLVRGGGNTLGVRMPDNEIALSLINRTGVPILGPSANFSGEDTPYKFEDLNPDLIKLVDFVLKGETKGKRQASTVIDCTVKPWKILRQGAVIV